MHISGQPVSLKDTIPMTNVVGQVEEFDEIKNMGVTHVLVKTSDTRL